MFHLQTACCALLLKLKELKLVVDFKTAKAKVKCIPMYLELHQTFTRCQILIHWHFKKAISVYTTNYSFTHYTVYGIQSIQCNNVTENQYHLFIFSLSTCMTHSFILLDTWMVDGNTYSVLWVYFTWLVINGVHTQTHTQTHTHKHTHTNTHTRTNTHAHKHTNKSRT